MSTGLRGNVLRSKTLEDAKSSFLLQGVLLICVVLKNQVCQPGYYRDVYDRSSPTTFGMCKKCPCNNHEDSCVLEADGRVLCSCKQGYTGRYCEMAGEWNSAILLFSHFKVRWTTREVLFFKFLTAPQAGSQLSPFSYSKHTHKRNR